MSAELEDKEVVELFAVELFPVEDRDNLNGFAKLDGIDLVLVLESALSDLWDDLDF
jgi:hypothetical protein